MSDAKWKLMVDWQGDGEFSGADDDITPAALGLSLRHMRDLRSEYIDPARLHIRLANFDHKYSPPNTASPLFGALKPGRKVWRRADEWRPLWTAHRNDGLRPCGCVVRLRFHARKQCDAAWRAYPAICGRRQLSVCACYAQRGATSQSRARERCTGG